MIDSKAFERFARRCVWSMALVPLLPLNVFAQDKCEDLGVIFGFFNGVQTTEESARAAQRSLEILYGPTTPAGHPITYDLFYNDTEGLADFAETFEQRLREHDAVLSDRFELFFSALKGERDGGWWGALTKAVPALGDVLSGLIDTAMANAVHQLTRALDEPTLAAVSQRHRAQIEHWAALDDKLLLFAHSQGNLFVNQAFAHALTKTDAASVRAVHVAPASPTLSGRHTLADKDFVINALRATGLAAPNTDLVTGYATRPAGLNGKRDVMGHGLLEIYLNASLSTSTRLAPDVRAALLELDQAPRKPLPPFPAFEPHAFWGGERPQADWAVVGEASHWVDRVELESDPPWRYVKQADGLWQEVPVDRGAAPGWWSTRYVGKGMGGVERCDLSWVPLEGWAQPQLLRDCTQERVPVLAGGSYWGPVEELEAYANAAVGTEVRLTKLTRSGKVLQTYWGSMDTPEVRFKSAYRPWWSSADIDVQEWAEPYIPAPRQWVGLQESLAWLAQWNAYLQGEDRRLRDYWDERDAYEKRRACRAI